MNEYIVSTKYGKVKGFEKSNISAWFGIPYATPPVGELRFKRAKEPEIWYGELDCTKMSAKPFQFAGGMFERLTRTENPASEDCLYLNVWSKNPNNGDKKPVIVWIYGGGQYAGEASSPDYYLDSFANKDIVGVSFNYRLGVLGFYDFSCYDESFDSNCAISDMLMALKWVNENIEAFGGDPENVTIAGESAGGTAIMALLASPYARPYFKRAIIMSGILSNIGGGLIQEIRRNQFMEHVGLKEENIGMLRDMSYEELLVGCKCVFEDKHSEYPGLLTCGPVYDDLIPESPLSVIERGDLKDKEIIFGTCKDEGGLFHLMKICPRTWADILNMLKINGYWNLKSEMEKLYGKMKIKDAVKAANKDRMFFSDSVSMALALSKHSKAYMYRFDFAPLICKILRIGATHTMDVCPGLDTYDGNMSKLYKRVKPELVEYLHNQLHGSFVRFIKTGNPAGEDVNWPVFEEENMNTYIIDKKSYLQSAPLKEFYELWKGIRVYK